MDVEHPFFVPRLDGAHMGAEEGERTYRACQEQIERETGEKAEGQPVYRLHFVQQDHGGEIVAQVGELDPYGYKRRVAAIIPCSDCYRICTPAPSFSVGIDEMRRVEYFAPPDD